MFDSCLALRDGSGQWTCLLDTCSNNTNIVKNYSAIFIRCFFLHDMIHFFGGRCYEEWLSILSGFMNQNMPKVISQGLCSSDGCQQIFQLDCIPTFLDEYPQDCLRVYHQNSP